MSILKREDPQTIVNILNGKQTILVMKKAPKNGEGRWWYLYCSKSNTQYLVGSKNKVCEILTKSTGDIFSPNIDKYTGNGKVVARFWCNKIEEIYNDFNTKYNVAVCSTVDLFNYEILEKSCLKHNQLTKYLKDKNGYAIHISKLEIFDRPRCIDEFMKPHTAYDITKVSCKKKDAGKCNWGKSLKTGKWIGCNKFILTKAPQNYCWVDDFFFDNEETKEPESVLIDEKETDGFCR